MDFKTFFSDKSFKAKQKTALLSAWILANPDQSEALLAFAKTAKDPEKATCIEAFEFAARANREVGTAEVFDFAVASLASKAPRVQWESAKVVGSLAGRFPGKLENAVGHLLGNTANGGTVVRWAAAFALGEIVKLKLPMNADLVPALESICSGEAENSIRKIYLAALKKAK